MSDERRLTKDKRERWRVDLADDHPDACNPWDVEAALDECDALERERDEWRYRHVNACKRADAHLADAERMESALAREDARAFRAERERDEAQTRVDEAYAAGERLRALIERMREENGYEERVRHDEEVIDELAQLCTILYGTKVMEDMNNDHTEDPDTGK